nr:DUF550 domain-containing protein [Citrobacter koseri]
MKTIQLSERELSMILNMLTPPYTVSDTHTDEFNELRNKVFYALRDAQNDEPVSNRDELPEEKGSSLQLRNLIRRRHAEWSDKTFGNVGPIGPLKHLSKEALEAAAEPDDLSEWADMQFLLWDAQRRAGISDGEITAAMEEKLKVNMARQWPEPKDGEPRLHIKESGNSPAHSGLSPAQNVVSPAQIDASPTPSPIDHGYRHDCECAGCKATARICADLAGWIPVSERLPEKNGMYQVWNGKHMAAHSFFFGSFQCINPEQITHWMPLPAAPQQE